MIHQKPLTTSLIMKRSRSLRKKMTPEERHLWYDFLRGCGFRFTRQYAIGNYIVDFYCAKAHLVIEVDGAQHYDKNGSAYNAKRTQYLESLGLTVVRILNRDIWEHFPEWCAYLTAVLEKRAGLPQ